MITYLEIFAGVLMWGFALLVVVGSFYAPNIYVGLLVFLLGLVNLLNAVSFMDSSFVIDYWVRNPCKPKI